MPRNIGILLRCLLLCTPLLFAACGKAEPAATPTPQVSLVAIEDSAREWLAGVAGMDGNKILKYTCEAQRESLQNELSMGNALSLLAGGLLGVQPEADVSDVKAQALEYTSDRARLQMGGELRAVMGAQAQAFPIGDVWRMVKENDTWRWCGTDSGIMPLSQDATTFAQSAAAGPTPAREPTVEAAVRSGDFDPKETVLIRAGEFQMGCSPGDTQCVDNEKPFHTVTLDAYRIDKYEVTNARFKECADAGACTPPQSAESATHLIYYGSDEYADYPVVNVDWNQANAFCKWDGGRLPTKAEWEKAARGSTDTRIYPWGDALPDCYLANFFNDYYCVSDTSAVYAHLSGASPYGVLDMSGNDMEWVSDWYQADYYGSSPSANPQGPTSGEYRVLRGGSWNYFNAQVRASIRYTFAQDYDHWDTGFRCARAQ